jgi:hypothetical protein
VIIRFVDIGGIVDHRGLNCPFIFLWSTTKLSVIDIVKYSLIVCFYVALWELYLPSLYRYVSV